MLDASIKYKSLLKLWLTLFALKVVKFLSLFSIQNSDNKTDQDILSLETGLFICLKLTLTVTSDAIKYDVPVTSSLILRGYKKQQFHI